ncbi:hypothetical protein [Pseudobacteriovorax antillogorgiicola]|uniref:Uncharacterized protein n=1 Tax=Pseudobacteriovorax antillogorgiicola TaxID=1513793 RepID=A0A1Y6C7C2_9BACT|nr:hypothetical protein [Pseudobacteriovorax antillogorgiicola]TCS51664.1 hypothetical protein EDD56_11049 [Pseudobacteriovorax antillogorgiicola]SMF48936.1 hypothetical protein SAMN06296036_11518 [Pseudobacteriovorax antillogorgiicola]
MKTISILLILLSGTAFAGEMCEIDKPWSHACNLPPPGNDNKPSDQERELGAMKTNASFSRILNATEVCDGSHCTLTAVGILNGKMSAFSVTNKKWKANAKPKRHIFGVHVRTGELTYKYTNYPLLKEYLAKSSNLLTIDARTRDQIIQYELDSYSDAFSNASKDDLLCFAGIGACVGTVASVLTGQLTVSVGLGMSCLTAGISCSKWNARWRDIERKKLKLDIAISEYILDMSPTELKSSGITFEDDLGRPVSVAQFSEGTYSECRADTKRWKCHREKCEIRVAIICPK